MPEPLLLVTGSYFSGRGLRAIMPVMQELTAAARREVHILAYVITRSAEPLLRCVEEALERGVAVTIVVNVIPRQPVELEGELSRLATLFRHARIRYFDDPEGSQLHAKVLVADRNAAVIGSANYSWGGLISNHEVGVFLEGEAARQLSELADRLATASRMSLEGPR